MSQSRPVAPEPSEIAGRYQIVQKLGAGAFGTVYKAKDKILGRMVAIKTIRLEGLAAAGSSIEELVDRFNREARISAQLKHPNIVTIYDVGEVGGLSYLAMEFIDGVGLDRIIAQAGRLASERAALIAGQVADALDFAHKASVVHRDIKPANIMIETGDRVKVTDFGIAKVTNAGEHLTITGSLLGTPSYMSPEQARGLELDGRSDLFAVGCLLYEMLSGRKAFRGDSITGLIFKIITEEPTPLHEIDSTIPAEMVRIVAKALSKAPETRYQSGRQLADDLSALTRPGSTPTLRQAETPTAPGGTPAVADPAAAAVAPTAIHAPTLRSAATQGVAAPSSSSAAAPTRVSPPPIPRAPARPPVVPVPGQPSGGRAGLVVGVALAAAFLFVMVAAGAWFLFLRKPPEGGVEARLAAESHTPEASGTLSGALTPPSVPPTTPSTGPATTTTSSAPSAPTNTRTTNAASERATASRTTMPPAHETESATRPPTAAEAPPPVEVASPLDEEPPPIDGEEAGRRLSESFRSPYGGRPSGTFGASARYRLRDRVPRNLSPAERPAVMVLLWVIRAEEGYYKKNARYATYPELISAQLLPMDGPVQATSFVRKNYRFHLTVESDGFKVVATPNAPISRPFVGDDTGIIRPVTE